MSKKLALIALIASGVAASAASTFAQDPIITEWTFQSNTGSYTWQSSDGTTGTEGVNQLNHPIPEIGSGTASTLGMSLSPSYTFSGGEGPGSIPWSDTTTNNGVIVWRVRGPSNASGGGTYISNGWNSAAPRYSQGASFAVSTSGYTGVEVGFDWLSTTQGASDLQVEYSTNGGGTWSFAPTSAFVGWATNLTGAQPSSWPNTVHFDNNGSGGSPILVQTGADVNVNQESFLLNFAGVPGVSNNPNFEVQLVSDYFGTTGAYDNSAHAVNGTGTAGLNNNSGNWRFGNVFVSGTTIATPEPGTFALLAVGAFGLAGCYVRRKRSA
jgi:hypothetical protein